jgi:hypothetical protein
MKARDGILFELLIISMNTQGDCNKINYRKSSIETGAVKNDNNILCPKLFATTKMRERKWLGCYYSNKNLHHKNRFSTRSVLFSIPENDFICRTCSGALAKNRSKSSCFRLEIVLVNVVSWFTKHFMGIR